MSFICELKRINSGRYYTDSLLILTDDQFIFALMDFFIPALTAVAAQIALLFQVGIAQPEVAKKIQAEVDRVVGGGRLPTLDDRVK